MEGVDPVAATLGAAPLRRAAPAGPGDQREDADSAPERDGIGRHRDAEGLQGGPAARRIRADLLRELPLRGAGPAMRMGTIAHEAHRGVQAGMRGEAPRSDRVIRAGERARHVFDPVTVILSIWILRLRRVSFPTYIADPF